MQMQIGIRLLNEGTDAWAMIPAQHVAANIYCILDNAIEEEQDCELEFKPGNLVAVADRPTDDGFTYPVAIRLYPI